MTSRSDSSVSVAEAVERYSRNPNPSEHERLRPLVADYFSRDVAEFFDREGSLPLRSGGGFPWPMKQVSARMYALLVVVASGAGAIVAMLVLQSLMVSWVAALLAIGVGVALWFGIPALTQLFPPADLVERNRLVHVFNEIVKMNRDAADDRALHDRMNRLLSENDSDKAADNRRGRGASHL